jgi:1,4-dihydroxy-2-naphthoate octaprenyltransferase
MYGENDGSLLLAVSLSMFTFALYFFGLKLSFWYFPLGFLSMIAGIFYWVKVKKGSQDDSF